MPQPDIPEPLPVGTAQTKSPASLPGFSFLR
jgi:hypothetical protein